MFSSAKLAFLWIVSIKEQLVLSALSGKQSRILISSFLFYLVFAKVIVQALATTRWKETEQQPSFQGSSGSHFCRGM